MNAVPEAPTVVGVYETLGSSILAGELPASTKLPPIRPSGDARRVSPNTVSSAYRRLEAEGLVFANDNGKRFVAPDAAVAADVASAARALIQESLRDGVGLEHTVLLIRGLWPAPEPQVYRDRETASTAEPSDDSRRNVAEHLTQAPHSAIDGSTSHREAEVTRPKNATAVTLGSETSTSVDRAPTKVEASRPEWGGDDEYWEEAPVDEPYETPADQHSSPEDDSWDF